jgi:hypothetical protein
MMTREQFVLIEVLLSVRNKHLNNMTNPEGHSGVLRVGRVLLTINFAQKIR